ncbi:hypothetical protein O4J55_28820, partial [Paracoccus sp. PXZ]
MKATFALRKKFALLSFRDWIGTIGKVGMPRIYITGASGVIGSEFVRYLDRIGEFPTFAVSRRPCPTLAADHPGHRQVATIF